jgi:hypothetical protein
VQFDAGGNDPFGAYRFVDYTLRNNVFSDAGFAQEFGSPGGADQINVYDWDGGQIYNNLVSGEGYFAFRFDSREDTAGRNTVVSSNIFDSTGRLYQVSLDGANTLTNVSIRDNTLYAPTASNNYISGPTEVSNVSFSNNEYVGSGAFDVNGVVSKGSWNTRLEAPAINDYFRTAYGMTTTTPFRNPGRSIRSGSRTGTRRGSR